MKEQAEVKEPKKTKPPIVIKNQEELNFVNHISDGLELITGSISKAQLPGVKMPPADLMAIHIRFRATTKVGVTLPWTLEEDFADYLAWLAKNESMVVLAISLLAIIMEN